MNQGQFNEIVGLLRSIRDEMKAIRQAGEVLVSALANAPESKPQSKRKVTKERDAELP